MRRPITVSAVAVLDLHDQLVQLGAATPEQLSAIGLERETLIDLSSAALPMQEQRLDEAQLLALWRVATSNRQVPDIGLLVGQAFNPSTRGVLASWLFQCTELGEALHVFQQHIALMNPSERWTRSETGEVLVLEFSFAPDKHYPQAAIERSMSALLRWSRELTGEPVIPLASEFSFPRPAHHECYGEIFGPNLHFDCQRNGLHLPLAFLRKPIPSANTYLKQLLEARALQAFEQLQVKGELIARVRQLIQANLQEGVSIEQVCKALHVSRPTLYRRLKQENTSFSELVAAVRKDLAYKQIQQGMSVAAVSEGLGFKDVSTFHRAFKRWFNQSPGGARGSGGGVKVSAGAAMTAIADDAALSRSKPGP